MTDQHVFMQHDALIDVIDGIGRLIKNQITETDIVNPAMIGIHTGGVWIARALHEILCVEDPLGELDISFYRDDFTRIGMNPSVKPSKIPFDVDDRHIILVDDVIESGRTIRAAMNEIFDFGRPASILLACLIDRGGRDLPIQPDVAGLSPPLEPHEHIRLIGPTPLSLEISRSHKPRHAQMDN